VRQVRNRDQQIAAAPQHTKEFGKRPRLFFKGQVLEHIKAESAIE